MCGINEPTDAPAGNNLKAVKVTSVPTQGTLMYNNVAVTARPSLRFLWTLDPAPQTFAAHPARQNGWTVDLREPGRGRVGPEARRRRAVEVEIPVVGRRPGQQRSPVGRRIHPHHRKDVRQTGQHVVPRLPGTAPCIGHEGENSHIGDEGRTGHVFHDTTGGSVTRQLQVREALSPRRGQGQ